MDRTSVIVLVVCVILLFLTPSLVNRIYPPKPVPETTLVEGAGTNAPPSLSATNVLAATNAPTVPPGISAAQSPLPFTEAAPSEAPEKLLELDLPEDFYLFTSRGGGLKEARLKKYPEDVAATPKGAGATNYATLNRGALLPAGAVFAGKALPPLIPYVLRREGTNRVTAEAALTNGLRVVKTFEPRENHVVDMTIRVENASDRVMPLPIQEIVVGTAMPPGDKRDMRFVGMQWFDGKKARFVSDGWFANRTLGCIPGAPRSEFVSPGVSNVVWAAVQTRFFVMIAAEEKPAPHVAARRYPVPSETVNGGVPPFAYMTSLLHPALALQPGQAVEYKIELFAGPKHYNTLAKLDKEQERAMNFTSIFGWFGRALLLSMNGLHSLGIPYGLTIVLITVIIKAIFWPLTQASTRSMKRMQALQPQMKAIQEKYKDDPQKMNRKLMEFMKEHRVSPLGGCLPILIQIPVFIGFYQMLQSAIELRGARFLWVSDLSRPDTVATLAGFPINPLPLIMGATQFWQARMTPASPGVDPVQQKLMQYMPLIFILILYNFPSGLALYWTVQNLLTILQMKLTRTNEEGGTKTPVPAACPLAGKPKRSRPKRGRRS